MIALIYLLPLVVMFVAYSVIGLTLWRRTVPGYYAHGANRHYLQAKKKVGARSVGVGGGPGKGGAGGLVPPPAPFFWAQGLPSRGRCRAQNPLGTRPGPKSLARA